MASSARVWAPIQSCPFMLGFTYPLECHVVEARQPQAFALNLSFLNTAVAPTV